MNRPILTGSSKSPETAAETIDETMLLEAMPDFTPFLPQE